MGPDGARYLASQLENPDFAAAKSWYDFRRKHSLPEWTQALHPLPYDDLNGQRRSSAGDLLLKLGSNAAPAFGAVWSILHSDRADDSANRWLAAILTALPAETERVVPQLADDIRDTNRANRVYCISVLASLGPKARTAIPALTNAAADAGAVGRSAAVALWKIDGRTNTLSDVLSYNLRHGSSVDQWESLKLLKDEPDAARLVVPALEHMLDSQRLDYQMEAEDLLMRIDPIHWKTVARLSWEDSQPVVRTLVKKILCGTDAERRLAMQKLCLLGPLAKDAVPALVEILGDWQCPVTKITGTRSLTKSSHDNVALAAVSALAEIGPASEPATDFLSDFLRQDQLRTHQYCRALGAIGPAAKRAIPILTKLLATNQQDQGRIERCYYSAQRLDQRIEIACALCLIDPQSANAVSFLKELCSRTDITNLTRVSSSSLCRAKLTLYRIGAAINPPSSTLIPQIDYRGGGDLELLGDLGPLARAWSAELIYRCYHDQYGGPSRPTPEAALAIWKVDPEAAGRLCLPGALLLPDYPRN